MNIFLWVLQALLAVHTAIGAVWKFSNSAGQTMPSLQAIPDVAWQGMAVLELLCSVALVLPLFYRRAAMLAPMAALVIAAEMLLFCALHLYAGVQEYGPIVYWLVVTAICGFIAYGRLVLKPLSAR